MHPFGLLRHPRPDLHPPPVVGTPPRLTDPGAGGSNDPAVAETAFLSMPGSFPDGGPREAAEPYQPTVLDVIVAKAMMHKALSLPVEMVDRIVDFAEYWPHTSAELDYTPNGRPVASGNSPRENEFLLRTLPLGFVKPVHRDPVHYKTEAAKILRLSAEHPVQQFHSWIGSQSDAVQHPCRKIVFTITSNDQGWGGQHGYAGTYGGSYTWFEAGLERIDASGECGDNCPDHTRDASDLPADSPAAPQPHISPCAMRPVVPALLGEPHERPYLHHPLEAADEYKIQCNKTAVANPITYTVEWRADDHTGAGTPEAEELEESGRGRATGTGEFVRNLKLGDVVTVWAKARFGGWTNTLRFLKVDVYWAI